MLELLLGMPYFGDSLEADATEFAERLIARLRDINSDEGGLGVVLKALTMSPKRTDFRNTSKALLEVAMKDEIDRAVSALRCDFYAASSGCRESAFRVAAEAVSLAVDEPEAQDDALELCGQALGWLHAASGILPTCIRRGSGLTLHGAEDIRDVVEMVGDILVRLIIAQHDESRKRQGDRRPSGGPDRRRGADESRVGEGS